MGFSSEAQKKPEQEVTTDDFGPAKKETKIKGGLKTIPFIIANETLEKVAGFGLLANMMIYLMNEYNMRIATGISILFLWNALSNFTPVFGAFLSDSFLGRYRVISLGTIASLLGMIILLLTATIREARPPHCDRSLREPCVSASLGQRLLLYTAFAVMSIGAGGIRPCSMAFGADQVNRPENPNNERVLQTFFSWYYASVGVSLMVAVTLIVFIQDQFGWKVGFGVPVGLMAVSMVAFFTGSPLYVKVKGHKDMFGGFNRVAVAAWKNRRMSLPLTPGHAGWYHHKGSKLVAPSDRLRFLNKAAIKSEKRTDEACTVRQVEELKALLKVLPVWSTGIFIAAVMSQHSIWLTQALAMDRRLTPHFSLPAGSFGVFTILTLTLWVALYDRLVVPLMTRLSRGRRPGLTFHQRMGIGLALACVVTLVAAVVERQRRLAFVLRGETLSAMWLIPQYSLSGLAEAFNAIGQIEFYYSQFPKTMASIAVALLTLGMAFGNLAGALIVRVVEESSSWLDSDLNKGRYDSYFWVMTLMGLANLVLFCVFSWAYGESEESSVWDEPFVVEQDLPNFEDSPVFFAA